jgi:tetratricopeptide (TPR) repeat protein
MGRMCTIACAGIIPCAAAGAAPQTLADLAASKGAECDLATAALVVGREFSPDVDIPPYLDKLDDLAREVAPRLAESPNLRAKLETLSAFIYDERGYGDRNTLSPTAYVGLHEVLDYRQWNCLGLSVFYVALGERLGLPLQLVVGPGHALVACPDGTQTWYIETTGRGRIEPSLEYLKTFLPFPDVDPARYAALDKAQSVSALISQTAVALFPGARDPRAAVCFRQAIAIDEGNAQAWTGLGTALSATGAADEAEAAFRKAIALDPRAVEAYGGLGNMLHGQGRLQDAIGVYRELVAACPREPRGNYNLARLLFEAGERDAALQALVQYSALQKGDAAGSIPVVLQAAPTSQSSQK